MERFGRLFRQHVERLLVSRRPVRRAQILVAMVQFGANVV